MCKFRHGTSQRHKNDNDKLRQMIKTFIASNKYAK